MYFLCQLLFIIVHFLLYLLFFCHFSFFKREKGMLIFHVVPFFICFIMAVVGWQINAFEGVFILGFLALQLIYSMTFLEIWSLSQGSYSLQILLQVAQSPLCSKSSLIDTTRHIGDEKKRTRLAYLISMGYIKENNPRGLQITYKGRFVREFFQFIKSLANIKAAG